jgi:hypothetical protein
VGWLAMGCCAAGAGAWVLGSEQFAVRHVDVEGLQVTPMSLVEPVAQALMGQNWARGDLSAAQARLAKLPTVKEARVVRQWSHWPPRLAIVVQERQGWVRLGGGPTWWVVDRDGIPFRRANRHDGALYALTSTALDSSVIQLGKPVPASIWSPARRLASALDSSAKGGFRWDLRRAYLDEDGMASLRLSGGQQDEMLVRLGEGQWPEKLARARRALAFFDAVGNRAQALNLVSYSRPTWTPRQAPPQPTTETSSAPDTSAPAQGDDTSQGAGPRSGEASSAGSTTGSEVPTEAFSAAPVEASSFLHG